SPLAISCSFQVIEGVLLLKSHGLFPGSLVSTVGSSTGSRRSFCALISEQESWRSLYEQGREEQQQRNHWRHQSSELSQSHRQYSGRCLCHGCGRLWCTEPGVCRRLPAHGQLPDRRQPEIRLCHRPDRRLRG